MLSSYQTMILILCIVLPTSKHTPTVSIDIDIYIISIDIYNKYKYIIIVKRKKIKNKIMANLEADFFQFFLFDGKLNCEFCRIYNTGARLFHSGYAGVLSRVRRDSRKGSREIPGLNCGRFAGYRPDSVYNSRANNELGANSRRYQPRRHHVRMQDHAVVARITIVRSWRQGGVDVDGVNCRYAFACGGFYCRSGRGNQRRLNDIADGQGRRGIDGSINGGIDGSIDGGIDGGIDGSIDRGIDGSIDGSIDRGIDGSIDGGIDGSIDGSIDRGIDGSIDG